MPFKIKKAPFFITVFLVIFLLTSPIYALKGNLEDSFDVNVNVKAFAGIENSNIGENDWINYESEDKFEQYLINQNFEGELEDIVPTSDGSTFTGNGAEEKWAATELTMFSNAKFKIRATATHLTGTSGEESLNDQLASSSDSNMVSHYLFPSSNTSGAITITPDGTTETTIGQNDINGFEPGTKQFILASKIKMPDDFWKIEAGKYTGTVTFTVEGL